MGMGVDAWSLEDAMASGFAPVWGFHESVEELKHKLLCTTLELESLRTNAKEEMRNNEENISQLLQLLQVITHQRDEAREQLQLVLTKITQPESPPMRQTRASSSITESDSLSGTPKKNHSYGGSPGHSLFNVAASPELPSMKLQCQEREQDMASAVINGLVTKPLPQKGNLLQAVLEAGPLLQTLLLAGPLPQWRNPPPLQQFQVPPVSANAHDSSSLSQKVETSANNLALGSPNILDGEKSKDESNTYSSDFLKRPVNLTDSATFFLDLLAARTLVATSITSLETLTRSCSFSMFSNCEINFWRYCIQLLPPPSPTILKKISCSCRAYCIFHNTSTIGGLFILYSVKNFSAAPPNFTRESSLTVPAK